MPPATRYLSPTDEIRSFSFLNNYVERLGGPFQKGQIISIKQRKTEMTSGEPSPSRKKNNSRAQRYIRVKVMNNVKQSPVALEPEENNQPVKLTGETGSGC